jgi:hypothetical protein
MTMYTKSLMALLLATWLGTLEARPPEDAYAAGLAAARAGEIEAAARHFAEARESGLDTPALAYNLGVVNFRLARWDDASTAFRALLGDPEWRALAYYNMGLIEERRQASVAAQYHFQQAYTLATDDRLKALAASKIPERIVQPSTPRQPDRWQGLVSFAGGHDDNVLLAQDQLIETGTDKADQFGEAMAAARRAIGSADSGLFIDVGAYYRTHLDLDEFDFGTLSAGLTWRRPVGSWEFSTGIKGDLQFSGGDSYANIATQRLQLERSVGTLVWRARNDVSYLSGGSDFDFVTGWRNRTQLQVSNRLPQGRLFVGYELELNDRDDLESGQEFASYSPTAHGPFAGALFELAPRVALDLRGSYRTSRYQDDNRFLDGDALVTEARDQDLLSLTVRLDYRLTDRWALWSQYQYSDSASDIDRYDYRSSAYLLGLETAF